MFEKCKESGTKTKMFEMLKNCVNQGTTKAMFDVDDRVFVL